jgi:hypothetical protein
VYNFGANVFVFGVCIGRAQGRAHTPQATHAWRCRRTDSVKASMALWQLARTVVRVPPMAGAFFSSYACSLPEAHAGRWCVAVVRTLASAPGVPKPKKPVTGYLAFHRDVRKEMAAAGQKLSLGETMRQVASRWAALSDDDKKVRALS